jgi:hypothetical protein
VVIWLVLLLSGNFCFAQKLVWQQRDGYRVAELNVPPGGRTGFTLLTPSQTGITFTNAMSLAVAQTNQNLIDGAGVASGDFDGDGWCDLYFANIEGANALYRNLGGFRFDDVTTRAGVTATNQSTKGVAFADINGDGRMDLLTVALLGPNDTFLNLGNGTFSNITDICGMASKPAGAHSLALADIDGNGTLDVYVANYGENSILRSGGRFSVRTVDGKPQVAGRYANRLKIINGFLVEYGEPDLLFLNDGRGHFTSSSWTDGRFLGADGRPLKRLLWDMGLSVMFRDINGDHAPDIYVCNDFQGMDRVWINDGAGRFRLLPDPALRNTSHFSMSADFGDLDRDGYDDFMCSDMLSPYHSNRLTQIMATNPSPAHVGETWDRPQVRRNTLQWNRGDLTWAEIAQFAGLEASDWTWSVAFLDVDLDGYEDILVNTGHLFDTQDTDISESNPVNMPGRNATQTGRLLKDYPRLLVPNVAYRNQRDRTFKEVGAEWGFNSKQVSHGISFADLDHDGDLDVALNCLWDHPLIYRNESSAPRVAVRCKGLAPNTQGIGAKIKVLGGAAPVQTQEIMAGGRYLSGDDPMRVFAAGNLSNRLTIEVIWRSGRQSVIKDAKANRLYEVNEAAAGVAPPLETKSAPAPVFADVSTRIGYRHVDPFFMDYDRQPLLARRYSTLGPGVAWVDVDADGIEDLVIGSGKDGVMGVFKSDGQGNFTSALPSAWNHAAPDDWCGLASWVPVPGQGVLLGAVANYENSDPAAASSLMAFNLAPGVQTEAKVVATFPHSIGPIAVADVDGDGDLDIFVGGRIIGGRYPEPAKSALLLNSGGKLQPASGAEALFDKLGLVSGAVFTDLTGDGRPELVAATEWGPLRVFANREGRWTEETTALGLDKFPGWWASVTAGDFDGDGRLDLIAGNWGLNGGQRALASHPISIFYGDFDGNGTVELLEAYAEPESGRTMPWRGLRLMQNGWPLVRTRFAKHADWAQTDAQTVLGDSFAKAGRLSADTLASLVFLNRGGKIEVIRLPDEAQFAPVFGINVADFDGDGREDVFLAQNFFDVRPEDSRLDAGRGLWLRGLGDGRFVPVRGQDSGVKVYGQQRGSAVADFDGDGRVDIVVAQNGGETKLFRNATGRPGLRVRLAGPPGNPAGIGAVVRLVSGALPGPARDIHAGSGYWSQDSTTQVLSSMGTPTAVQVRWPDGREQTMPVPAGAKEVTVKWQ